MLLVDILKLVLFCIDVLRLYHFCCYICLFYL